MLLRRRSRRVQTPWFSCVPFWPKGRHIQLRLIQSPRKTATLKQNDAQNARFWSLAGTSWQQSPKTRRHFTSQANNTALRRRHDIDPPKLVLVRAVAASWSLKTQLKAPKREHAHTFFGATTAATFMQLRADLFDGPHPQHINFSVRRSVSDYRTSIYFLAGSILRTAFSRASWPVGSSSVTRLTRNSTVDKRLICTQQLTSSVPALGGCLVSRP